MPNSTETDHSPKVAHKDYHKAYCDSFDAWVADDATHWLDDKDAAWQAWMYLHDNGLTVTPPVREDGPSAGAGEPGLPDDRVQIPKTREQAQAMLIVAKACLDGLPPPPPEPSREAGYVDDGELVKLLPGVYYMDPPDGGSVTIAEQVARMAEHVASLESALRSIGLYEGDAYHLGSRELCKIIAHLGETARAALSGSGEG